MENKNFLHRSAGRRSYTILQAVKYISETNNLDDLEKVLTEDIPPNKLIYIALKVEDWRIRQFISNMNGIREYMESQSYRGAIDIAQKINDWDLWAITLSGSNISPNDAMYFAKHLGILKVSQAVFSRDDVPWQAALAYVEKNYNIFLWQTVLMKLPADKAYHYSKEVNFGGLSNELLAKRDMQEFLASGKNKMVA